METRYCDDINGVQSRVKETPSWKTRRCVRNLDWRLAWQGSFLKMKSYKDDEGAACDLRFSVGALQVWIGIYPEACVGKYRHKGGIETFLIEKDMNKGCVSGHV